MYLGCPDRWAELADRAALFGGLDAELRLTMLRRAADNDLRGTPPGDLLRASLATGLRQLTAKSLPTGLLDIAEPVHVRHRLTGLSRSIREAATADARWSALERAADEVWGVAPGPDPWTRLIAFNTVLVLAGHIPVVGYAFGDWQLSADRPPDRHRLFDLVELATCYLYRLSPAPPGNVSDRGTPVGSGAYSTVHRLGGRVVKRGSNLAARSFALEQEALLLREASGTPVARHAPGSPVYDRASGELVREYVAGPTGHQLLVDGRFQVESLLRDRLADAHRAFAAFLGRTGCSLDLHPGNFVWDAGPERWVLVDFGPVPRIGSDYYNLLSFDSYLTDTWLRRLELMRTQPVRSLEWQ